jgi:hypothetical protein
MYAFTFIRSPFQMNFVSHLISMKQRPCRVQSRQAFPIPSFISVWFSPARSLACPASCGCPNSHTFTTVEGVCVCVCVCVFSGDRTSRSVDYYKNNDDKKRKMDTYVVTALIHRPASVFTSGVC